MDIKEIAVKSVNGEDITELTKDFTDEQKVELAKAEVSIAKELRATELEAVSALRKEKTRLGIKAEENAKAVQDRIQAEQLVIAKARLIAALGITPEDADKVCAGFTPESVSAEPMLEELKRRYAFTFADKLIKDSQDRANFQKAAEEFNAQQAGGGGSGGGSGDNGKTYSPEVHAMVREANKRGITMTLDEAERGLNYRPRVSGL